MTAAAAAATFVGEQADWEPWIGYIRVSTWREEKISPEIQEIALRAWALRTRRRLLEPLIQDLDESGRHFKRKIMRGIEAVERREARGIAVWKYSRFGRTDLGVRINVARLEHVGGQLESATEEIDLSTAVGRFSRNVLFDLAAFESDRAGEQWQETHALRIKAGVPATGRGRFGYLWTPRRVPDATSPTGWRLQPEGYALHPDYAPISDELYERKTDDHDGFNELVHWMNDDLGIPGQRGGLWSVSTLQRMMDSGFAAGLLRIHDPECRCPYRTAPVGEKPAGCAEGRMIYVPGAQPAILNPDRWAAYLEHRAQTKSTPPRARKATYPLTGLLRHGACRAGVSAASDREGGVQVPGYSYVCSKHKHVSARAEVGGCPRGLYATRAEVERQVRAWAAEQVDPVIGQQASTTAPATAPAQPDRGRITVQIAALDAALTRAATSHAKGVYDDGMFIATRDRLRAEKAALTAQLDQLGDVAALPTRESLREATNTLAETWDGLTSIEANGILRQVIRRVVIHDRREPGVRWMRIEIEVHPRWEPDPWSPVTGVAAA